MPKDYKKENPRILSSDIYSFIANNTSLTKDQVKECFGSYYDLINQILNSNNLKEDLTISFPRMGKFYFHIRKGRKKGSTYKFPIEFSDEMETIVLEEDEPNYLQLKFEVSNILKKNFKERTKGYDKRPKL